MDFEGVFSKQIVVSDKAPFAIGPYSHATKANGIIYTSGCIGIVRETKALISDNVVDQARQSLENLKYIIEAAGSNLSKVVKCTVFLVDMADFASINTVYAEYFPENPPARSCVAVKQLPAGALFEIECICLDN